MSSWIESFDESLAGEFDGVVHGVGDLIEGEFGFGWQLDAEFVLGRVLARLDGWAIPIHDALIVRARDAQRVVEIFKEEAGALLKLGLPLKVSEMGNLWTAK